MAVVKKPLTLIFVVLTIYLVRAHDNCKYSVKLTQTLHNEGFHRNLTYEIECGGRDAEAGWCEGCSVALEQVLPPGLYASPDQIEDMKYKTSTVFKSRVDTEVSAERASAVTVHLLAALHPRTLLSLPLHARYQPAHPGGGYVELEVPMASVYMQCGGRSLDGCGDPTTNKLCPRADKTCLWRQVPAEVTEPARWRVPRGDAGQGGAALAAAAGLALASLHLLHRLHHTTNHPPHH